MKGFYIDLDASLLQRQVQKWTCQRTHNGGCSNFQNVNLNNLRRSFQSQTAVSLCAELCSRNKPPCAGFGINPKGSTSECVPRRAGCQNDKNPSSDYYSMNDCLRSMKLILFPILTFKKMQKRDNLITII